MATFAKLNEENIVIDVTIVSNNDCPDPAPDNESLGIAFLSNLGFGSNWKQTSVNSNFRKRTARPGDFYNSALDAFMPPQPFASWTLDEETWEYFSPTPKPSGAYDWDETTLAWVPYPQPYPSFTWANNIWNAPTPYPTDGGIYDWDEAELAWIIQ